MYNWHNLYDLAQSRATELAHVAEQKHMLMAILASSERAQRRRRRRHALRVKLLTRLHVSLTPRGADAPPDLNGEAPAADPADAA